MNDVLFELTLMSCDNTREVVQVRTLNLLHDCG